MFERPPNGFFVRDLILFNQLRRGGHVAKGFIFEAPDLTNSPITDLNDFQEQLCLLLASLHENQRLQVQYFSDSAASPTDAPAFLAVLRECRAFFREFTAVGDLRAFEKRPRKAVAP